MQAQSLALGDSDAGKAESRSSASMSTSVSNHDVVCASQMILFPV